MIDIFAAPSTLGRKVRMPIQMFGLIEKACLRRRVVRAETCLPAVQKRTAWRTTGLCCSGSGLIEHVNRDVHRD